MEFSVKALLAEQRPLSAEAPPVLPDNASYYWHHILFAGRLASPDGGQLVGRHWLMDLPDHLAAAAFKSIFTVSGVFETVKIERWSSSMDLMGLDFEAKAGQPLYLLDAKDVDDAGTQRDELRAEHEAFQAGVMDQYVARGPLLSDDGARQIGSLMIIDVADEAAARDFLAREPFESGGLFAQTTVHQWLLDLPPDN